LNRNAQTGSICGWHNRLLRLLDYPFGTLANGLLGWLVLTLNRKTWGVFLAWRRQHPFKPIAMDNHPNKFAGGLCHIQNRSRV
jgi:hypothetical protein